MYKEGQGVTQDYKEAFKWFEKSANQGDIFAQNNLGEMYNQGQGIEVDKEKAKQLYKKSCDKGLEESCKKLKEYNF